MVLAGGELSIGGIRAITDYNSATADRNQVTPAVTWAASAPIGDGIALIAACVYSSRLECCIPKNDRAVLYQASGPPVLAIRSGW